MEAKTSNHQGVYLLTPVGKSGSFHAERLGREYDVPWAT
jgi:hypothetical protein